jgi:hypothetical protein
MPKTINEWSTDFNTVPEGKPFFVAIADGEKIVNRPLVAIVWSKEQTIMQVSEIHNGNFDLSGNGIWNFFKIDGKYIYNGGGWSGEAIAWHPVPVRYKQK